jgi:phospholipid/cholesterol/gamma-HCH transport system permease protein
MTTVFPTIPPETFERKPRRPKPAARLLGRIGRTAHQFFGHSQRLFRLFLSTLYWAFIAPLRRQAGNRAELVRQLEEAGVRSFGIVFLVAFLIGVILVLQTAHQLKKYGQIHLVAGLVAVSMVRELGPLMTAIVVTGRVGAAITAELGTMKAQEEILALETMAVNPVGFLVAPRFLALLIMLPALTCLAFAIGMAGGALVAAVKFGISPYSYLDGSITTLDMADVVTGVVKSVIFAVIIANVAAYYGVGVQGGSESVGRATMVAVVTTLVLIILFDCLYTAFATLVLEM